MTRETTRKTTEDRAAEAIRSELQGFGARYEYDVSYLLDLLAASPDAYASFAASQGMSRFRAALPLDAHYVARIATMQVEDCGACAQLNLRMAVEDGVERAVLRALLDEPEALPDALRAVREHARAVCAGAAPDAERARSLRRAYGDEGFAEFAVVVAGARVYPTLKRALREAESCQALHLDF